MKNRESIFHEMMECDDDDDEYELGGAFDDLFPVGRCMICGQIDHVDSDNLCVFCLRSIEKENHICSTCSFPCDSCQNLFLHLELTGHYIDYILDPIHEVVYGNERRDSNNKEDENGLFRDRR